MARLDKKYAPFVKEAKKAFQKQCEELPKNMRRTKRCEARVKYFDILSEHYSGKPIKEIAYEKGYHQVALRNLLAETQNKVRQFVLYN